ncbi:MAG: YceI family protein [Porticoccaceae bacterium]
MAVGVFMLVWLFLPLPVFATTWEMESRGSELRFVASYLGDPVPGEFRVFMTSLKLDGDHLENSALVVVVDITSMSLGSADLEEGAATAEWFDFERYPKAEFRSNRIRQLGSDTYEATGLLNIKGLARTATVPFTLTKTPHNTVMTGQVDLVRTHFHVGSGKWGDGSLIGLNVAVIFKVLLQPAVGSEND